jgi:apolipoprotein N-acyltransferase
VLPTSKRGESAELDAAHPDHADRNSADQVHADRKGADLDGAGLNGAGLDGADFDGTAATARGLLRPRGLRTWQALTVALAGGLALDAAFPPIGFWPLAAVGPALLVVAIWRRSLRGSFAVGLIFGLAFFVPLLSWVLNVAWYAWAALAGVDTLLFAGLVIGQRILLRLRFWPLAVAGWWVAAESIRDRWPFGGFPWGRLVMSQSSSPTLNWVAVGGPILLTFLVGLAGGCLAWLLLGAARRAGAGQPPSRAGRVRAQLRRRAVPAAGLAGAIGVAVAAPLLPVNRLAPGTPTAEVAAVQGNVPHVRDLPDLLRADTVTTNHADATLQFAARVRSGAVPAPDVVIWPENSTDQDPSLNPFIYSTISAAVNAIGRPVLVGAVLQNPLRNAGQLWRPGKGPGRSYVKRRLVPFGEVIPFRGFLDMFTSLPSLQPVNFTPGHKAVVFHLGKIQLGDVICYEVGFDGLVSSEVKAGANLLTVQTNDADFELDGQTGETLQQLAMARVRAVEHDRSVAVASTTGVSAIIAPNGKLLVHTGTWQRATIEDRVPLISSTTLADKIGGWPEGIITGATLAALAWAILAAVRDRRSHRPAAAAPTAGPATAAPAGTDTPGGEAG